MGGASSQPRRREYAAVANALADFEPVTMVVARPADRDEARSALAEVVEVVEIPLDDSWMRDNGPIFRLDNQGRRAGRPFRVQRLGREVRGWDRDEAAGGDLGRPVRRCVVPGASRPRGRFGRRGRDRAVGDDGTVPSSPEPQPRPEQR